MAADDPRDEVDLAAYAQRMLARWWIVAICVAIAIAVALVAGGRESSTSFEGRAIVSLGVPLTAGGQIVAGAYTNTPVFAQSVVRQASVQAQAAQAAGLKETALRGRATVVALPSQSRTAVSSQVQVVVQGPWGARQAGAAAQSLAEQLVAQANVYPEAKRTRLEATTGRLETQIAAQQEIADAARQGLASTQSSGGSAIERAITQQGLLQTVAATTNTLVDLQRALDDAALQIEQIDQVESARVLSPARGVRVDTAAKRASLAVAIALGLVVGLLLAALSLAVRPVRSR